MCDDPPMAARRTPDDPRLAKMPDDFLECREDRHDCPSSGAKRQRIRYPDSDVVETRTPCVRCGSIRIKVVVEQTGELYQPTRYDYAEGYLSPEPGTGRIPLAAVRRESIRRWLRDNPLPKIDRRTRKA